MKSLITGAGGWLGSELTERLLERGNKVRALILEKSDKLNNLKDKYKENLEIIEGNVCNLEVVNSILEDVDVVYHLAAKVHSHPKNKEDNDAFFKINTIASKQLFEACIEKKIERIIFYSSVSVYGNNEKIITTKTEKNPCTTYAKSKLEAEVLGLKLNKEKGLPITIIEPVTVYGGDDVGNFEKLKQLSQKGFLVRFGNGENKKTVIYYKDLIEMTLNIAKDRNLIGEVIICGSEVISINDINKSLKDGNQLLLKIPGWLSKFLIRSTNNFRGLKKISRQIEVLMGNNVYDIDRAKRYIDKYKSFEEYYSGRD